MAREREILLPRREGRKNGVKDVLRGGCASNIPVSYIRSREIKTSEEVEVPIPLRKCNLMGRKDQAELD